MDGREKVEVVEQEPNSSSGWVLCFDGERADVGEGLSIGYPWQGRAGERPTP